jgi:predicted nucleotidyltransferase
MATVQTNDITLAILHGSRVTGAVHENSDWDVAVLGSHKLDWDEIANLRKYFAKLLNIPEEKIDIADLHSDSPLLRYRAAMQGKLLEGNEHDFRKFQLRAWKDYLNNQKMFDLRSQFLKNAWTKNS